MKSSIKSYENYNFELEIDEILRGLRTVEIESELERGRAGKVS